MQLQFLRDTGIIMGSLVLLLMRLFMIKNVKSDPKAKKDLKPERGVKPKFDKFSDFGVESLPSRFRSKIRGK